MKYLMIATFLTLSFASFADEDMKRAQQNQLDALKKAKTQGISGFSDLTPEQQKNMMQKLMKYQIERQNQVDMMNEILNED